jgi:hypothetical protein
MEPLGWPGQPIFRERPDRVRGLEIRVHPARKNAVAQAVPAR